MRRLHPGVLVPLLALLLLALTPVDSLAQARLVVFEGFYNPG